MVIRDGYDVDALRLLRLVRFRRVLRFLTRMGLMAIPVWAGAIIVVQEVLFEPDASVWNWFGEHAGVGFLLIFVVLGLALITQVGLRFLGQAGRVAAQLVPLIGRGGRPVFEQGEEHVRAFLPPLSRKSLVGFSAIFLFCAAGFMLHLTSSSVVPAFQASQGLGGPEVVIGKDVTISRTEAGRWGTTYFLSTRYGEVVAEGTPERGEHWIILRDDGLDNGRAYRIGGFAYLGVGGLALLSLLVAGAVVAYAIYGARSELRRRASDSDVPLVDSVQALMHGHQAVLRVWRREAGPDLSVSDGHPARPPDLRAEDLSDQEARELAELYADDLTNHAGPADDPLTAPVSLGLSAQGDRSAGQVLRRRRFNAAGAAVVAVAVVATPVVLFSAGVFESPPTTRFITLSYLASSSWQAEVYASYDNTDSLRSLVARVLADEGSGDPSAIERVWSIRAESAGAPLGELPVQANLDVVSVRGLSAPEATTDFVEFEREIAEDSAPASVDITGLPPEWQGIVAGGGPDGYDRAATAAGYADGTLIRIRVDEASSDADLTRRLKEFVDAIASRGIARFAADTARPA